MRVYSKSFVYLYDIRDSTEALIDSFYVGEGKITIILPITHDAVYFIEKNGWIVSDEGEPFIVKILNQSESQATYTAFCGHRYISQRVAKKNYVKKTGSADAVVKYFIDQLKTDLPITTAAVQSGPSTSDQIRLTNLGVKVADVLTAAGRGERYTLSSNGIIFDTYAGTDRSVGNAGDNPNVIFALEYGNVDDPEYVQDGTKEQTTVYVAGAGEGDQREVYVMGDDATGVDRVEVIADARDVAAGDTATLTERAAQYLIDDTISVSATAIADSNMEYGVDYFLGDICTIKVKVKSYMKNGDYLDRVESTVNVNKRLVEVVQSYKGGTKDVDLVFGSLPLSTSSVTKKEVESLKAADYAQPKQFITVATHPINTDGHQTITCGFRPRFVKITSGISMADSNGLCIGAYDGVKHKCILTYGDLPNYGWQQNENCIIFLYYPGGGAFINYAAISSIDDNGFVLEWSHSGTLPGTEIRMLIEALG